MIITVKEEWPLLGIKVEYGKNIILRFKTGGFTFKIGNSSNNNIEKYIDKNHRDKYEIGYHEYAFIKPEVFISFKTDSGEMEIEVNYF